MKKLKLFDRNLYIEALRQLRTVGVVSGVIFLLQSVLVPLGIFVVNHDNITYENIQADEYISEIPFIAVASLLLFVAILMPLMANILFSFINQRNASDFYHALPVRRETMYITYLAAILSWCLTLFIVPALLEYLFFLPVTFVKLDMSEIGYMFADTMVIGLLLTSAVLVAKCVTGTRFGTFAVMSMILFLPRLYLFYIRQMVEYIHPFVILNEGHNFFWDESWNLLLGIFESWNELRSIIYTLALSVIYLIIAGVLFVKRKSEKAESVSISSRLQLVLRVLPALTFSLLPIFYIFALIYSDEHMTGGAFVMLVILYVIAIVIYFLYELLTTRKLRSVVKAAPGLLVLAAANIAMILFIRCYGDYQARLCPSIEEITSVRFINDNDYYSNSLFQTQWFNEQLEDIEFHNDEISEIVVNHLKETQEQATSYSFLENDIKFVNVEIKYNGRTIYRKIKMSSLTSLRNAVIADESFYHFAEVFPEYDSKTCKLDVVNETGYTGDVFYLAEGELVEIYNQALEELALLDNAAQYALVSSDKGNWQYIHILFWDDNIRYTLKISVDRKMMPKTWKLIQKYSYNGNPD